MTQKQLSKISIQQMQKSQVDEVALIEELAYGEHHWSKESFYNELANNLAHYFVAIDNGKIIGYAGSWQIIDEAHITTIAVHPDFRRKKIGEALLKKTIDLCYENKIKYITLEVRKSNSSAISMYEKYGFKSLGVRKGYYQNNNEDALIMWTENIFWDKFKSGYNKNIENLKNIIEIDE